MLSAASAPVQDSTRGSSQAGSAGSQSAAGPTARVALPPRSYASATATATNTAQKVPSGDQHAPSTPLSAKGNSNMAAPVAPPNGDHGKKPSVTITAAGASGHASGGGPVAPAAQRAGISFGQFSNASDADILPAGDSPQTTQASLSAHQGNPRITIPAKSPSPIPQPIASGGRPPSGFQSQNGALNFGSMSGAEHGAAPPVGPPQASATRPQPGQIRRQSSQQSDSSNPAFAPGGQNRNHFARNNSNRGQNYGSPGAYPQQQVPYASPGPNYRQMAGQPCPGQGFPPQYANQQGMGGYPGNPQSPGPYRGSQPGTPNMQHLQMYGGYQGQMPGSSFAQYNAHPGSQQVFGHQPDSQPGYNYYQGSYQVHPSYLGQGPPASPSPYRQAPPTAQQQSRQGQSSQNSQPMSRTPSHTSTDRPGSSLGPGVSSQAPTPISSLRSQTPSQGASRGAVSANFTVPKREKKAIVVKDANGNVITFDKKPAAPASVKAPSPAPVSSAATPTPPPASSTPQPAHSHSESKSGKSAQEIKAQFADSVRKSQAADQIKQEDAAAVDAKAAKDQAAALADKQAAQDKSDAEAKAAQDRADEQEREAKAAQDKRDTEAAQAKEAAEAADRRREADAKAAQDKAEAEKVQAEKAQAEKAQAEKLQAEKVEAEKVETERIEAERVEAEKVEAERVESEKVAAEAEQTRVDAETAASTSTATEVEASDAPAGDVSEEDAAAAKKKAEDEEFERQIAEMEALEKEEEERERAYAEKKKAAADAKAAADKASSDEELKRAEREAEALEEKREKEKSEPKNEDSALFASLAKPTVGPGAEDGELPSEDSSPPTTDAGLESKTKPSPSKPEADKPDEPAQPTAAMKSLKSARMLQIETDTVKYPDGIQSPKPEQTKSGKRSGKIYDTDFLMQFQEVFKEKPSIDWEDKLKMTIGDGSDSGSGAGARGGKPPTSGGRAPSGRGAPQGFQPMGTFNQGGPRPMGRGTTSEQRFQASNQNPLATLVNRPPASGGFQLGTMSMGRNASMGSMPPPRGNPSRTGRNESKKYNGKESEKANKSMPLTANGPVASLVESKNGWKPPSVSGTAVTVDLSGHMPPDMVQKKVKAALNKMTPERFEKLTGQILDISAQSKDEQDGRTLRQVIQLTFEKACDEAHWAAMYAKFSLTMLQNISEDVKDESIIGKDGNPVTGGGLFRKYLLNRCQEEFEHGWEVNLPDKKEGESEEAVMLSDEYYKAMAAKRKGLGLVQFIGELYKLKMLSIKIMHHCFLRLLDFTGMPEESTIESIVKLMRTVGGTVETEGAQGQQLMDSYFERIDSMFKMEGLPSRMHFMLLDLMELRKNHWRSKDDAKGPKTIQEIRDEAAAAAAADAARQQASRNQPRIPSGRGGGGGYGQQAPPPDYRGNTVATDDLRRLGSRQSAARNPSNAAGRTLGPTSMFSRSGSGRAPGPSPLSRGGPGAADSRSASKKDDAGPPPASANAFSALAGLQGEGAPEPSSPPKADEGGKTEDA